MVMQQRSDSITTTISIETPNKGRELRQQEEGGSDCEKPHYFSSTAYPPMHSMVLILIIGLIFVSHLSFSTLDEIATSESFTTSKAFTSISLIGYIRLTMSTIIFVTTMYAMNQKDGTIVGTVYLPSSNLKESSIHLHGIGVLAPFTVWCWNLLGLAFLLSGCIAIMVTTTNDNTSQFIISPWILRIATIAWQVGAANSLLVACVVKYVIWPMSLKSNDQNACCRKPLWIVMHNVNVVMTMIEILFLGNLPIRFSEISFAGLFGCCYVIFTWIMAHNWKDTDKNGPQFLYFFMDTTLEGYQSSIALLVLLFILLISFGILVQLQYIIGVLNSFVNDNLGGNNTDYYISALQALILMGICSFTCRIRD